MNRKFIASTRGIIMNEEHIRQHAQRITCSLGGFTERDAILILTEAISLKIAITQRKEMAYEKPCSAGYLFLNHSGLKSKIERDPEILAFLYTVDRYKTIAELCVILVEKFGRERAPSKSALHRFLKKHSPAKNVILFDQK